MITKQYKDSMEEAAELIRAGELVAVPTETVYGLAGNGLDENAVRNIYEVKGRPAVKPLSLMVPDAASMEKYCENVPAQAKYLAEKFWPGPLTIVLQAKAFIPSIVLAGGTTVGLRCPAHAMTLELLHLSDRPFAAPSANPSGEPSPKTAEKVMEYFDGRIAAVVDGGPCGIGTESTIISMAQKPYRILRKGALSEQEIADTLVEGMTVIGITGGTGCGKTTALETLEKLGALIIDCDEVYHRLLSSDKEMLCEIGQAFSGTVINGELDRKALGKIVFEDPEALLRLNTITHSHVLTEIGAILRAHAMSGGTLAAIDAIELLSAGLVSVCDMTVAVTADEESRVHRIMERDGISEEYARARVKAQHSNEYFTENCSYVLENNSGYEEFVYKCDQFFKEILQEWMT